VTAVSAPVTSPASGAVGAPTMCTTCLGTLAFALSLLPSVLPRPAWAQAVLSGLLVTLGIGLARPLARLERRLLAARVRPPVRWAALSAALVLVAALVLIAGGPLQEARRSVGVAAAGPSYWPTALAGSVLVAGLLLAVGRVAGRWWRRLTWPRATRALAVCALVPLTVGAAGGGPVLRALPLSGENEATLSRPSRAGAVRVYVGIEEGGTPRVRAALAVRRMERRGAFDRRAVLVAFPTGSGWVNIRAVNAFERGYDGDLATVAVQGGTGPSWLELLVNRPAQEASAQALFEAVSERLASIPPWRRPDLHLYGESLGALLGQSVLDDPRTAAGVCSMVWAGVPGGVALGLPGERILRNPDDPVPLWGLGTVAERPEGWPADRPWVPGVSYLATTLDLVSALGVAPGHGHVYGEDEPWRLSRSCGRPDGPGVGRAGSRRPDRPESTWSTGSAGPAWSTPGPAPAWTAATRAH